ncbi:hypothetical protein ACVWYN_002815 [Pedobacter sp. UYP24]
MKRAICHTKKINIIDCTVISKSIFFFILIFNGYYGKAQHKLIDQLNSTNWEIIGTTDFKTVNEDTIYPIFSSQIKKYQNKIFELEGYMIPLEEGIKQSKFMLSTLPINQCFYCGKNGNPIMVMVELVKPLKFTYKPVKIKGKLILNNLNSLDIPPIVLEIASVVY